MCDINGGDLDIMARRMMAGASQVHAFSGQPGF